MISPSFMKITRSATVRAKPISWVTQSMVMPDWASSSIASSTSLIISGSRAEVGSSNSMTLGFGPRGAADDNALALTDGEIDIFQDIELAVPLMYAFHPDHHAFRFPQHR